MLFYRASQGYLQVCSFMINPKFFPINFHRNYWISCFVFQPFADVCKALTGSDATVLNDTLQSL